MRIWRGAKGLPGLRGERGERGSTGERGAERGAAGIRGEKGERGRRGQALPRPVMLSFVAVGIVSFLVLSVLGYYVIQNRQLIQHNRTSLMRIDDLRQQRLDDLARVDKELCMGLNEGRDVLGDIIRGILKETGGTGPGDAARFSHLRRLEPRDCSKLPTVAGNP